MPRFPPTFPSTFTEPLRVKQGVLFALHILNSQKKWSSLRGQGLSRGFLHLDQGETHSWKFLAGSHWWLAIGRWFAPWLLCLRYEGTFEYSESLNQAFCTIWQGWGQCHLIMVIFWLQQW
jgi:hypothetical protein